MHIPAPAQNRKAGLSMLFGGAAASPTSTKLLDLPISSIHRNESQPRTHFDADAIASLATSIEANGVIQPIAVRCLAADVYEIIAGERRWLAAQQVGLTTIPAVIHDVDERETLVLALVENIVRENLNPLETARAYAALQDEFSMSITDLAKSVGKSRPAVSNTLRLLELPDDVLQLIENGRITEGHGRALLGAEDRLAQLKLARLTVSRSLTVRALEALVRSARSNGDVSSAPRTKWNREPAPELVERLEHMAEQVLGVRARVKLGDSGGKLEFLCSTPGELVDLVDQLEAALPTKKPAVA